MKNRILIVASVAVLGLAALVPAVTADEPPSTPIVAACEGNAGYDATGSWYFSNGYTSPFSNCTMFSADDTEEPQDVPTLANLLTWFAEQGSGVSPVAIGWGNTVHLSSAGDPCTDATISGQTPVGADNRIDYNHGFADGDSWELTWTATFADGVGDVTGTAHRRNADADEDPTETRALSGTIVLDDPCNTSQAFVRLVLK